MNTNHHDRLWRLLAIAAVAAVVPAAAAQARPVRPAATARSMLAANVTAVPALPALRRSLLPAGKPVVTTRVHANVNPASYSDATSDNGTAADITSVVVSNDAANQITFRVNVVKLVVPSDGHVVIAIDSDHNAATGYHGVDYMFLGDLATNTFGVGHWNGSEFDATSDSTASAGTDGTGLTFSINSSELGNTTGFSFWTRTVHGSDVSPGTYDDAPDQGTWDYQLGPTAPLRLSVGDSMAGKARAGKPFVAAIAVARSDGADATLSREDVTCVARAGTTPLKAKSVVATGPAAGCSWLLPKKSRGKVLHASITVALDGATVTKTFAARIR